MSPRLLLAGFGSFPAAPLNPSAAVIATLAREGWAPPGSEIDYLTLPVQWQGAAETILREVQARPVGGILVVGVAVEAQTFRVETLGRNCASPDRPDQAGRVWGSACVAEAGEDVIASTAPCQAMASALETEGLPVTLSEDAGDYLCNFTLYRLLHTKAAPKVGFLHVPQARECAETATFDLAQIRQAVSATAAAFCAELTRPAA
ncbi:MAG: hypothetical protein Q8N19_05015 [Phenylobacterium sp.]|uniref:pyroglutamyl-peptidase I family protein n=1 Tax=Phenylobacterium sp. TaxID=1871053 RepID=UPI002730AD76|nr:hypothetical protein [Phenylobacterium sp.]MDP1616855.1 hypothetical protein [Phenylobacterium sp.]MDP3116459.1 hypothetical protein [Phenylobacterium sp.]MDP3382313.1 hypothetical protein [Phenylobacterium sp.]